MDFTALISTPWFLQSRTMISAIDVKYSLDEMAKAATPAQFWDAVWARLTSRLAEYTKYWKNGYYILWRLRLRLVYKAQLDAIDADTGDLVTVLGGARAVLLGVWGATTSILGAVERGGLAALRLCAASVSGKRGMRITTVSDDGLDVLARLWSVGRMAQSKVRVFGVLANRLSSSVTLSPYKLLALPLLEVPPRQGLGLDPQRAGGGGGGRDHLPPNVLDIFYDGLWALTLEPRLFWQKRRYHC
ncbi:hypothetical protein QBC33DRAFT_520278 [Phialemonium atrogriseum]|uniref:Uncharacterized protein n=1 Tax=Phialemonium atrogriseum TaxID=1093897 RepID=A0AAJ0BNM2_9PEZI|nr:uncharacterized protein QBC33DRAFT_520278 [Phialemonium atrogriseum]KAK1761619.1 hypothetical protein QBC33DRAFT_520278 [Phialemonium atrogriseum]